MVAGVKPGDAVDRGRQEKKKKSKRHGFTNCCTAVAELDGNRVGYIGLIFTTERAS